MELKYDERTGRSLRTSGNLLISGVATIAPGDYDEITLDDGADVTIDGVVTATNFKFVNNSGEVKVNITSVGDLRVYGSLNLNKKVSVSNYGKLSTLSTELQGSHNAFVNYGTHNIAGDLQLMSGQNAYRNCGVVTISNAFNLNGGTYEACSCGQLMASIINNNGSYGISGKGFIKITNIFNNNGFFTSSPDIELSYCTPEGTPKPLDETKLGSAKRVCVASCVPPALPVKYTDLKAETYRDKEGNQKAKISMNITESSDLIDMRILTSSDGRKWTESVIEDDPTKFVVGQVYSREFYLKIR